MSRKIKKNIEKMFFIKCVAIIGQKATVKLNQEKFFNHPIVYESLFNFLLTRFLLSAKSK